MAKSVPETTIQKINVLVKSGETINSACEKFGVSPPTYYRRGDYQKRATRGRPPLTATRLIPVPSTENTPARSLTVKWNGLSITLTGNTNDILTTVKELLQ